MAKVIQWHLNSAVAGEPEEKEVGRGSSFARQQTDPSLECPQVHGRAPCEKGGGEAKGDTAIRA